MSSTLQLLCDYDSRNITYLAEDGTWPIVWKRAKGLHVCDIDGKKYLDFTAAFAVVAKPRVTKAAQQQLARELSKLTFERWKRGRGKTIFCNSGFEAVEAALKTALLATGKKGVIACS